jgi:hypothetical protein
LMSPIGILRVFAVAIPVSSAEDMRKS